MPASSIVPKAAYLPLRAAAVVDASLNVTKNVLVAEFLSVERAIATVPFLKLSAKELVLLFSLNSPTIGVKPSETMLAELPVEPPCMQNWSTKR